MFVTSLRINGYFHNNMFFFFVNNKNSKILKKNLDDQFLKCKKEKN